MTQQARANAVASLSILFSISSLLLAPATRANEQVDFQPLSVAEADWIFAAGNFPKGLLYVVC